MKVVYDNLTDNIKLNPQVLGLIKYASRVKHASILGAGNGLSLLALIIAGVRDIRLYDSKMQDVSQFRKICEEADINFAFICADAPQEIENTELLLIDTISEANYNYSELSFHYSKVSRYMLVTKTYTHAHDHQNNIRFPEGVTPAGLIHGINNFIVNYPNWHILEHLYWEPGLTILYNRKDPQDHGR
jgi:hypothetical protein